MIGKESDQKGASEIYHAVKFEKSIVEIERILEKYNYTAKNFMNDSEQRYGLLHWGARHDRLDVVQFALEEGCDPNALTGMGSNALHYTFAASPLVIDMLIANGCREDQVNRLGYRADYHFQEDVQPIPLSFLKNFAQIVKGI